MNILQYHDKSNSAPGNLVNNLLETPGGKRKKNHRRTFDVGIIRYTWITNIYFITRLEKTVM